MTLTHRPLLAWLAFFVVALLVAAPPAAASFTASDHSLGGPLSVSLGVNGKGPTAVVAADLNGDGYDDLATANSLSDDVSVLLSAAGSFLAPVSYPVGVQVPQSSQSVGGEGPQGLAAADLNGDGSADLVTANTGSGDVSVLLNAGVGVFVPSATYAAGSEPVSVATADFDGDGDIDVATANRSSDNVTVLLNDGNANFTAQAASPFAVGDAPTTVVAADVDGLNGPDLVTANSRDNTLSVLLNNGSGTFAQASGSPYTVGRKPLSVTAADLDGQNGVDLAAANMADDTVTVLLNNGSGGFSVAGSPYLVGDQPWSVTAVDVGAPGGGNGDGHLDLAVANRFSMTVSVLLNDGTASLTADGPYAVNNNFGPLSVAGGDFDSDGDTDLATANDTTHNVTVFTNT